MKNTISGRGYCRILGVLALAACSCTATIPLVRVHQAPNKPGNTTYREAHEIATKVIEDYQKGVSGASRWMLAHHLAEAVIGASAVGVLLGGGTKDEDNGWLNKTNGGAALALLGVILQVVSDEGAMERQREAYARGISVMECSIAVTNQANYPGQASKSKLTSKQERARADILLAAIDAVESSVTAAVVNATLGDTRGADNGGSNSGGSKPDKPAKWPLATFWKDGTNRCLSRLVPDIRPLE